MSDIIINRDKLRTLRDKAAQTEDLTESNARLADELQQYQDVCSRTEGLEKENKRLARELQETVQKLKDASTPADGLDDQSSILKATPGPVEPPSSARRIEIDASKPLTKEQYHSLVAKYNDLFENWMDMKNTRKRWERTVKDEKEKQKKWNKYCDSQDRAIAAKDERIQRLEEEIDLLRAQLQEPQVRSSVGSAGHMSPIKSIEELMNQETLAGDIKELTKVYNADNFGPFHYRGKVVAFDDAIASLNSSAPDGIISRRTQVPASSPVLYSRPAHPNLQSTGSFLAKSSDTAGDTSPAKKSVEARASPSDPTTLPRLQDGAKGSEEAVDDTEFEPIEPHSEITEGDPDPTSSDKIKAESTVVKTEPLTETSLSPDTPIVILSHRVKKRKELVDGTEPIAVSKIKVETISSSPIGLAAFCHLDESIDLDDIGEKVDTPRKRRRMLERTGSAIGSCFYVQDSPRRMASGTQDHGGSKNPGKVSLDTPNRRIGVSRTGSALRSLSTNKKILPRTSNDEVPRTKRIASDKAVGDLIEDGENTPPSKLTQTRHTLDVIKQLDNLLAKPSPPKQLLSPARLTSNPQTRPSRPSSISRLAYELEGHQVLGHDEHGPQRPEKAAVSEGHSRPSSSKGVKSTSVETSRQSYKDSLRTSLEPSRPSSKGTSRGSIDPSRPSSKGSMSSSKHTALDSGYFSRPTSRSSLLVSIEQPRPSSSKGASRQPTDPPRQFSESSVGDVEPQRGNAGNKRPLLAKQLQSLSRQHSFNADVAPDHEPLRFRQLGDLGLEDFRVNPNYNQGYNYAFTDVVRHQAARRCLPGCTKPECCGNKFRALAQLQRNPEQALTMSQEEGDEMLLEEFLGDNFYKLRNMSKDERDEALIQARTRELSKKHGKHRQAYERRPSPPGYWRADFPTTQEEDQDRVKAKQFERDLVAQRYEEAMRPGGAYLFRDE